MVIPIVEPVNVPVTVMMLDTLAQLIPEIPDGAVHPRDAEVKSPFKMMRMDPIPL